MLNRKYSFGVILFNSIFSLMLFIFFISSVNILNCVTSAKKINIPSFQMVRIILYGSSQEKSGDTISGRIALMDTNGNEIAVMERSWQGSYLFMDFTKTDISGKNLYFPCMVRSADKIYEKKSKLSRPKGTYLYPYYIENHQCLLYSGFDEENIRNSLYKIARFAKHPGIMYFSNFTKTVVVNLSACQSGVYYGIFVDEDGKLILREE